MLPGRSLLSERRRARLAAAGGVAESQCHLLPLWGSQMVLAGTLGPGGGGEEFAGGAVPAPGTLLIFLIAPVSSCPPHPPVLGARAGVTGTGWPGSGQGVP